MKGIFYILFICLAFSFTSDNGWKPCQLSDMKAELLKTESFFKSHPTFSVTVSYNSYKGHNAETPFEKADGYVKCNGSNLHSFLVGIRTIQTEKYRLVVDTAEMTIAVSDPEKVNTGNPPSLTSVQLQKNITACKYSEIKNGDKKWRAEYASPIPLVAEEYTMGNDARIKEHIMYYRSSYATDEENANSPKAQPKLKVVFGEYNLNYKPDAKKDFDPTIYFKENKEGKLLVAPAFQGYQIYDLRISKNIK